MTNRLTGRITIWRRRDDETAASDDRVLPLTRWIARLIIPILAVAFLILYGMPDRTTEFFAWTIQPEMTPLVMGAGYGVGAYFFYRVATVEEWHRVAAIFPGIATFTWFMAVATVLHWANFNHDHLTFVLWVVLYAITPLLIPAIWWMNRRTDPVTPADGAVLIPRRVRLLGGAIGIVTFVGAFGILLVPELLIGNWPWTVSPLTARILAGWFALFGVVNIVLGMDPRWSAAKIALQTQLGFVLLLLIGIPRAWDNFDPSSPLTWGVIGLLVAYLGSVVILYRNLESV